MIQKNAEIWHLLKAEGSQFITGLREVPCLGIPDDHPNRNHLVHEVFQEKFGGEALRILSEKIYRMMQGSKGERVAHGTILDLPDPESDCVLRVTRIGNGRYARTCGLQFSILIEEPATC